MTGIAANREPSVRPPPHAKRVGASRAAGRKRHARLSMLLASVAVLGSLTLAAFQPWAASGPSMPGQDPKPSHRYPLHENVRATTFWVGEIYDLSAGVEGQNIASAYDGRWMEHYGGCDGIRRDGVCQSEPRTAANGWFPSSMTPSENPFYLALPFDDVNDPVAFAQRNKMPWAGDRGYAGHLLDRHFSYMKNRWVGVTGPGGTCYGQIEDAGPAQYHDFAYVFGRAEPVAGYGVDLSPALFHCVGLRNDAGVGTVDWRFVDVPPDGPWKRVVTARQLS
jgi:hypothetical protein